MPPKNASVSRMTYKVGTPRRSSEPGLLTAFSELVEFVHVFLIQFDGSEVALNSGRGYALGQHDNTPVDLVGDEYGGSGDIVLFGHSEEIGVLVQGG